MKHFLKKTNLQGAGKGQPKPEPAILRPPKLGSFKMLSSYSVAEIVDLISDGPIEGLVNQNNELLGEEKSILQGVYLDNTAIEVTSKYKNPTSIGEYNISNLLNKFGDIYIKTDGKPKSFHHPKHASFVNTQISDQGMLFSDADNNTSNYYEWENPYSPIVTGAFHNTRQDWIWRYADNATDQAIFGAQQKDIGFFSHSSDGSTHVDKIDLELHYSSKSLEYSQIIKWAENKLQEKTNSLGAKRKIFAQAESSLSAFKSRFDENKRNGFKSWSWEKNPKSSEWAWLIVKIKDASWSKIDKSKLSIYTNDGKSIAPVYSTFDSEFSSDFDLNKAIDIIIPSINSSNTNLYSKKFDAVLIFKIRTATRIFKSLPLGSAKFNPQMDVYKRRLMLDNLIAFSYKKSKLLFCIGNEPKNIDKTSRYNFLNASCSFRNGEEYQSPLDQFEDICIDYEYGSPLYGPYDSARPIQRIIANRGSGIDYVLTHPSSLSISLSDVKTGHDGSQDQRNSKNAKLSENYSDWNTTNTFSTEATSITHTVENPLVTHAGVSLVISALSDTAEKDDTDASLKENKSIKIGSKLPAIVVVQVEIGKTSKGSNKKVHQFAIAALIEGSTVIDLGQGDNNIEALKGAVINIADENVIRKNNLNLFKLPNLNDGENPTEVKRYIKISKLSAETNSVLIRKDISLAKVTEIVKTHLSYPFSAVVGIKLDARSFSSIPERSYDCRLKRIKIPSNYFPINETTQRDKRYITDASSYDNSNRLYIGDWDGTFKEGWTDNPAWILYDLLISKRYGLGAYIDESQINKWELYRIARFCDAVNDDGYFIGVSDGVKGLEPRYSCNIVFKDQTKIFDAINIVASLFRGIVFFANSEIHFLDDRPRLPISLFSNTNVKDGLFNYGNTRRDQQFNTIEVSYLDRFDNYQSKIEYVQDEADIRKRGVFKTTVNTMGVTSRAMARRIGQHLIYQTIKENQSVEFIAGLDVLLCRPGDLVIVEDELKTRAANYGRVLDINNSNKSLRIDNVFDDDILTGTITVFTPTGYYSNDDFDLIAAKKRSRADSFSTTGLLGISSVSGNYYFSGYTAGYASGSILPEEFPLYTGKSSLGHNLYCYYNTGFTGFVFSTGKVFQDNNIYDKIITNTGVEYVTDILSNLDNPSSNITGYIYDSAISNRRGSAGIISGSLFTNDSGSSHGVLNSELNNVSASQITKFNITGYNNSYDFGSTVYLDQTDPNISLLSVVSQGSPYRIERKNASDQIFKIISIKENNSNEYSVVATKYNTGKFVEIENFITEDYLPATFWQSSGMIASSVAQLDSPVLTSWNYYASGSVFDLSGQWQSVSGATGYSVDIYNSIANQYYNSGISTTGIKITGLSNLGNWEMKVSALGNNSTLINSLPSHTGVFVAYSHAQLLTAPVINSFQLN